MSNESKTVLVGVESYLGDRLGRLKTTVRKLQKVIKVRSASSIYELDENPLHVKDFTEKMNLDRWAGGLSAVLMGETNSSALELLEDLQEIEMSMNMTTRCIDIDLLVYGDDFNMTPELNLPHPELHRRPQMLVPASEVWPDYIHPVLEIPLAELSSRLQTVSWGQFYSSSKTLLDFSSPAP